MSRTTNESSNGMLPKDQIDSPSLDEGSYGGSLSGRRPLKKGPWTSAEDSILVEYVKKYGEGNWNAVQKNSGLSRCGKSCRLRWANHLKPHLKKGAFTTEEEKMIIELHSKMGNKWARMAAYLPGRTDNEIKNYWNTRIKRCQRAGLPLYPQNMCFQVPNGSQRSQSPGEFNSSNKRHNDLILGNNYSIPDVFFENFKPNQGPLPYATPFPDNSMRSMLSQGFGSPNFGFINPTANGFSRHEESETLFPGFHDSVAPTFEQFSNDTCEKINGALGMDYPFDPDPRRKSLAPFGGAILGSHALLNGNFSASKPLNGTEKSELPSLQYPETDLCSQLACPYSPHETVDTYIQSPPATASVQSDSVSPQNNGLLEALLRGAQTVCGAKNQPSVMSSNSSAGTPTDTVEWSTPNLHEKDWEESSDPFSPLGCSSISVFSEFTPPISGSPSDEFPPGKAPSGTNAGLATGECVSTLNVGKTWISALPDFSRPDALLGSDWLVQGSEIAGDYCTLNHAIAALLGEDSCGE